MKPFSFSAIPNKTRRGYLFIGLCFAARARFLKSIPAIEPSFCALIVGPD